MFSKGFQNHVKRDHNMWAYIYYSMYLDQIDVTNHNAIEKYVYDKVTITIVYNFDVTTILYWYTFRSKGVVLTTFPSRRLWSCRDMRQRRN